MKVEAAAAAALLSEEEGCCTIIFQQSLSQPRFSQFVPFTLFVGFTFLLHP